MPRFATAAASYRANTEDRSMVRRIGAGWIVCIADGVGGISGGARAADAFVASVERAALRGSFDPVEPAAWSNLLQDIDAEIVSDPVAGETTGIAIAILDDRVVGASCGDSRAYLSSADGWRELTIDQSRKQRLGSGRARPHAFRGEPHGTLVAGSDGLFDYLEFADIALTTSSPSDRAGDALVQKVRDKHRSLPDDIAVVIGWLDELV